ncbi:MAG: transglycosylase domain-containing protein, partial [Leptospira sp.]|nr:transglycosylase domain-containing protein [Leptospira sp.]
KSIRIFDKNGFQIGEFNRKNFRPIRSDNLLLHANLVWAVLSAEDRNFFSHPGVSYTALFRAMFYNLTEMRISQGGSTITQQLAKLSLNLRKRNISTKLAELYCAFYIEQNFNKNTILAMYLNRIFLGEGNTGMEEASRYYFNKEAQNLSYAEAAMLAGIIPAPSVYNPVKNLKTALSRQKKILQAMAESRDINPEKEKIPGDFEKRIPGLIRGFEKKYRVREIKTKNGTSTLSDIGIYGHSKDFRINLAPGFNEKIRQLVFEKFSNEELESSGLNVYTTLDFAKQTIAEKALKKGLASVRAGLRNKRSDYARRGKMKEVVEEDEIISSMQGSFISLNPQNGQIEVYCGENADEIFRQPGSAIKGIIYALALERKIITPISMVRDEKINISGYSPNNWYRSFRGEITVRQAVAQSVNTVPVKLLKEIGINFFLEKLSRIISVPYSDLTIRFNRNLSLALGSGEMSPVELGLVYATIANGGYNIRPAKINRITDSNGVELLKENESTGIEEIIDPVACAMTVNLLESIFQEGGTFPVKLNNPFPIAGKSGTVQSPKQAAIKWGSRKGIRDSWFAGILPGSVSIVWIGNKEGAPFPGSGSKTSGSVWLQYALGVRDKFGIENAMIPEIKKEYAKADICAENGKLLSPGTPCKVPLYGQYFYKGSEPKKQDTEKKTVSQEIQDSGEEMVIFPDENHETESEEPGLNEDRR